MTEQHAWLLFCTVALSFLYKHFLVSRVWAACELTVYYECLSQISLLMTVSKCVGCRALNARVWGEQWPCGIWRRLQFHPSFPSHTDVRPDQTSLWNSSAGQKQTFSSSLAFTVFMEELVSLFSQWPFEVAFKRLFVQTYDLITS